MQWGYQYRKRRELPCQPCNPATTSPPDRVGEKTTGEWITPDTKARGRYMTCEPLVTADRAGELLKLHPKTVKKMAQAGVLPAMKIGRVWRFRESSLDEW